MSFNEWRWLFPVAIALHNLEEAIWLPAWSNHAGKWHRPVSPSAFRFAVAVFTAVTFLVTIWSAKAGPESVGSYLLAGFALAMLLNVLILHLLATVVMRRYMPGLGTAIALNLPITVMLLRSAFAEGYVRFPTFAYYGLFVCVALVASIPVLFAIGEKLTGRSTT
ncbi:MAG: HXXEE domain-containing protein [Terriglobia bacterium]|jgi:hypothetical protein